MNALPAPSDSDRLRQLITELIDGELTAADAAELNRLLGTAPGRTEQLVDQLILDSILSEELGSDSLTALVDLATAEPPIGSTDPTTDPTTTKTRGHVAPQTATHNAINTAEHTAIQSAPQTAPQTTIERGSSRPLPLSRWLGSRRFWQSVGVLAVIAVSSAAFVMGRWDRSSFASSTDVIVRAAMDAHAAPVERIYIVQTERSATGWGGFKPPRDVRVTTQGDRFHVEMNRGERSWHWGLDTDGSIWLTLGSHRAIVIDRDEWGPALYQISSLYKLNLETLLQDVLKHCSLRHQEGPGGTYAITATPQRRWIGGGLREATIEVDRETKAVRRLVIQRDIPQRGASTVTFTLVEARTPDESKYRPQGHLVAPYRLLTRETRLDNRREFLANWFGAAAERWLKIPEAKPQ